MNKLINQVEANLDQYKVNYTTDGRGTLYTDSLGFNKETLISEAIAISLNSYKKSCNI